MFLANTWISFFEYGIPCYQMAAFYLPNDFQEENSITSSLTQEEKSVSEITISIEQMRAALEKSYKNSKYKFWTEEEDKLLWDLAQQNQSWVEISKSFFGKSFEICKRRYERLVRQSLRWPKETENLIKHLFEVQKLQWKQIQKFLPMYTKKQIKERYKNFLEVTVIRAEWTIEQDLHLWQMVNQNGKKWIEFTKIFEGRTQLQLKNRYNKFIKPTEDRLILKFLEKIGQQSRQQE